MSLYLQNKQRRQRRTLLIATIVVAALFGLNFATRGIIATPVRSLSASVWSAGSGIVGGITQSGIFTRNATLAYENAALRQQVAALQEQLSAREALVAQISDLQQLAHMAGASPGITAPIISSFKSSPYGTFLVGVGQADGVVNGALVLSKEGFVVGRVTDASAHESLVSELFAPQTKVDVLAGNVPITLTGKGGGNAEGDAPRGSTIATGTPVVAPSFHGFSVGVVGETQGSISSASVKVYVRTPINIETLRLVYVERRP